MDNFNKTDDLYDPNFSIDSNNTEKLDMYGVWLKKKKNTVGSLESGDSQTVTGSSTEDQGGLNLTYSMKTVLNRSIWMTFCLMTAQ